MREVVSLWDGVFRRVVAGVVYWGVCKIRRLGMGGRKKYS